MTLDFVADICRPVEFLSIYPGYISTKIAHALELASKLTGEERIIEPGTIHQETIGDCRYAVSCKDFSGAEYRVTVECIRHADGWQPHHLRPGHTAADRIHQLEAALKAIQTSAEHLSAINPSATLSATLIASLAKETLEHGR